MATMSKRTTTKKVATKITNSQKSSTSNIDTIDNSNVAEEVNIEKKKKEYNDTDGIICKSITPGGLYMVGLKSNILYKWIDAGDTIEIEYQDLLAAIRSHDNYVMSPLFVIEDEELVSQYPHLSKIYESLYAAGELESVLLDLDASSMKATILSLPSGAQNSIKSMAAKMISDGSLDSIKKIKILDEIFDTEMSVTAGLFN